MTSPKTSKQPGADFSFVELLQLSCDSGFMLFDHQGNLLASSDEAAEGLFEGVRGAVKETILTGRPINSRQIIPQGVGKNEAVININTVILHHHERAKPQVLVVLIDRNIAEKLEQSLRQLNRLASIGILSASLAHEMKNALVPVRTFFELRNNSEDELNEIANQGLRRVESLVRQILKYGGPAKAAPGVVHVHVVLENALRLIQHQLSAKMITLERSLVAASDCVQGEPYQLEQAFSNLLINALEAMQAGGQLSIATDLLDKDCRLRVRISDTGAGIAPENLARLFDTFFTTKPNGTGLGLTITRRILQEHDGVITVDSTPNKGTTFTVTLPSFK